MPVEAFEGLGVRTCNHNDFKNNKMREVYLDGNGRLVAVEE